MDDDMITLFQNMGRIEEFKYGDIVYRHGEEAKTISLVEDGRVALRVHLPGQPTTEDATVSVILKGRAFGWSSFVAPYRYRLSCYCVSPKLKLISWNKSELESLFEKNPVAGYRFKMNVVAIVGLRLHHLKISMSRAKEYIQKEMTKITVHMSSCGIAAGAGEVMAAIMEELQNVSRYDILVVQGGCIGKCATEPNVTVEVAGKETVVYQKMTPEKIRNVLKKHVFEGQVQRGYLLS
jgi:NADP-reducing hydrogenase subunit HndB